MLWWIRNGPWKRKYVVNLPGERRWTACWAHPGEGILICSPPQHLPLCWETVPHSVWALVRHRYENYKSDVDRQKRWSREEIAQHWIFEMNMKRKWALHFQKLDHMSPRSRESMCIRRFVGSLVTKLRAWIHDKIRGGTIILVPWRDIIESGKVLIDINTVPIQFCYLKVDSAGNSIDFISQHIEGVIRHLSGRLRAVSRKTIQILKNHSNLDRGQKTALNYQVIYYPESQPSRQTATVQT